MIDCNKTYSLTKNFTVLYIEDDISFLRETSEVFEELFFQVDTAMDGKEGLELYNSYFDKHQKHYDLVITDINMPHINGVELIKELYKLHANQPIIVISAHDESSHLLELVNLGIEQFLIKPIDFDVLLKILCKVTCTATHQGICQENAKIIYLKDDISWNKKLSLLYKGEDIIKLTKNETFLMKLFIKNECKISTLQEIINSVCEEPENSTAENLKPLISRLRKKIPCQTIESVYGLGYRLVF